MGRAPCCDKANVKKGPWSPEEDAKLKEYIEKNGTGGNWIALPHKAGDYYCLYFSFSSYLLLIILINITDLVCLINQVWWDVGKAADWDGLTIWDPTSITVNSLMMKIELFAASLPALGAGIFLFFFFFNFPFFNFSLLPH